jgi:HEAT repeats
LAHHDRVLNQQLDLFADVGVPWERSRPPREPSPVPAADLDDASLIAALPHANLAEATALAGEAGRRRLAAAVPALAALCRRFAGFGANRAVLEQIAALEALAKIGGVAAAEVVAVMIEQTVLQGPTLKLALGVAARLGAALSVDLLRILLRHRDPEIRAQACRCARPILEPITLLIDLLDDLDPRVAKAAALRLGQMGRAEARPMLASLLRDDPSDEVIDSIAPIADEECLVLLGRIARSGTAPTSAARDALESSEHPRATAILSTLRQRSNLAAEASRRPPFS